MIKLDKTKSYYLGDLSERQKQELLEYLQIEEPSDCWTYFISNTKYLYYDNDWLESHNESHNRVEVNALELFYTLENVQVYCRELSEDQIKSMCKVYESNGYEVMKINNPIKVEERYVYFQYWDSWKSYWVGCIDKNKHTITYDKFMELFSKEEESVLTEIMKDEYKPTFCDEVNAAFETGVKLSESLKLQPHYDNSNGSLYKICDKLGLNSYEFDIIKRVVRCRKKGQFAEDLKKTKDLIDLYLLENEQSTK